MKKLLAAVTVLAVSTAQAATIYVDDDASLGGDGASWNTAYQFLQDAIANAVAGTEIRIGQGVYKPDQDEAGSVTPGDRTATFQMLSGVALMGGYAGAGAPDPEDRNIALYATILSGDLLGDDAPDFQNNDENSINVVTASGTDPTAVLDGLTITAGWADIGSQRGGGMYNVGGSPTVSNCSFRDNASEKYGGGVYSVIDSHPTFTDCHFENNQTLGSGGGAIAMINASDVTLERCSFVNNTADSSASGGAVFATDNCSVHVIDSTFSGNFAGSGGGGAISTGTASDLTATASSFADSFTTQDGGAVRVTGFSTFTDCTFTDNYATHGAGAIRVRFGADIEGCTFTGNAVHTGSTVGNGGAVWFNGDGTITGCTFAGSSARRGALYIETGDPVVRDCLFLGNTGGRGPGVHCFDFAYPMLFDCVFIGNQSTGEGGAIFCRQASPTYVNCLFTGNTALAGGASGTRNEAFPLFVNCTFSQNYASLYGGGMYGQSGGFPTLVNCILWGNTDADKTTGTEAEQILINDSSPVVNFTCVEGLTGSLGGAGNIAGDPAFVNAPGEDGTPGTIDDNLRLQPGSPCIDAGDSTAVPAGVTTDLDINPRFVDDPDTIDSGSGDPPIVDMGAYEFQGTSCPWDCDGGESTDGTVGIVDFLALLTQWGSPGSCDFDGGGVGITDFLALLANWGPCP